MSGKELHYEADRVRMVLNATPEQWQAARAKFRDDALIAAALGLTCADCGGDTSDNGDSWCQACVEARWSA